MLIIKVETTTVSERSGISKLSGKPYTIRTQPAWVILHDKQTGKPDPYPTRIQIPLKRDQNPYEVGAYTFDLSCFLVNKYSELSLELSQLKSPITDRASLKV